MRSSHVLLCGAVASLWACGGASSIATPPAGAAGSAQPAGGTALEVPLAPERALWPRSLAARGLANPRGLHFVDAQHLLVATAGGGDPAQPDTGALLLLTDSDGDARFVEPGASSVLLGGLRSRNILDIVRRDEVFGMAGMAASPDTVLVSLAFFGGPTQLMRIDGSQVTPWSTTHLNINDLVFDPRAGAWYGVASTTDEVVQLLPGDGGTRRVLKIPPLASGQDAVPGYLIHDPASGLLLVSLFSGSPEGEEGGEGVELVPRAAGILGVDPATGRSEWIVTGLTVPTDLEIGPDGALYVLEFCDSFLDPVGTREAMAAGPSHGGFRRFSGRMLRIDRASRQVQVVAEQLDAPTNLTFGAGALYVAEGMGTPGRLIPGPDGKPLPLEGYIERVELPAASAAAITR
jgi:hypothetical protein